MALLLLTRIPAAAQYLSVDNVNLALALERFDPRIHQPQPPGYPFFVAFARLVNLLFHNAEKTFLAISIFVSALCLPLTAALGRRMFDRWVGQAAAVLLLVNPVFWFAGLEGPLRPNLALFSLLTAYCSWRAWNGDRGFVVWGAFALGIGSGFRPDLLVLLAPVWLFSAWVGTRSIKTILFGCGVLAVIVLTWAGALAYAVGGVRDLFNLTTSYLADQSRGESVVFGASTAAWFRQINRLMIWNGLAVVGWIWAVPLFIFASRRAGILSKQSAFMIVWLAPGLMVQALIHVAAPGHTLFSIPALCLIGAHVLWAATQRWKGAQENSIPLAETALALGLIVNVMLFLDYVPLPAAGAATSGSLWESTKNAAVFGIFETSIGEIRYMDDATRNSLREVQEFSRSAHSDIVVVCEDVVPKNDWFMVWPIARYYLPEQDIWVISAQGGMGSARRIRRHLNSEILSGPDVLLRVPKPSRIIWLMERGGALHQELEKAASVKAGQQVFYTDVGSDAVEFQAQNFIFRPGNAIQ